MTKEDDVVSSRMHKAKPAPATLIGETIELIAVLTDDISDVGRTERIERLIAKVVLLGLKRGRPAKEIQDEDAIAA